MHGYSSLPSGARPGSSQRLEINENNFESDS
jgi:hypothetical protein